MKQTSLQAIVAAPVGEPPNTPPSSQKSLWPLLLFAGMSAGLLYALLSARKEVNRKKDLIEQLLAEKAEAGLSGDELYPDELDEDPVEDLLLKTFF